MATTKERTDLGEHGLNPVGRVHWNLPPAELIEHAVWRGEGQLSADGSFVTVTAPHTGRSPNDKFTVKEPSTEHEIAWGGVNVAMEPSHFEALRADVQKYLNEQDDLYVRDVWAGADPQYRLNVRVVTPSAWHSVFVHNMFLEPFGDHRSHFQARFTVFHAPDYQADPEKHGCRSGAVVAVHLAERQVVIAGTKYAGEVKKSIFSVMNYLLPKHDVLSMHCSANVGDDGDVALFFGLSGTGKTTLSANARRHLIGDDEHCWTDDGVFNIEGGCYAKTIDLSAEKEPEIYSAIRYGTVLENVGFDEQTRQVDWHDTSITQNTRASYPIDYIPNAKIPCIAGHPKDVVFLTADAFGVLPPVFAAAAQSLPDLGIMANSARLLRLR